MSLVDLLRPPMVSYPLCLRCLNDWMVGRRMAWSFLRIGAELLALGPYGILLMARSEHWAHGLRVDGLLELLLSLLVT